MEYNTANTKTCESTLILIFSSWRRGTRSLQETTNINTIRMIERGNLQFATTHINKWFRQESSMDAETTGWKIVETGGYICSIKVWSHRLLITKSKSFLPYRSQVGVILTINDQIYHMPPDVVHWGHITIYTVLLPKLFNMIRIAKTSRQIHMRDILEKQLM